MFQNTKHGHTRIMVATIRSQGIFIKLPLPNLAWSAQWLLACFCIFARLPGGIQQIPPVQSGLALPMPGCMFWLACMALGGNFKFPPLYSLAWPAQCLLAGYACSHGCQGDSTNPPCAVWHGFGNAWLYVLACLHGLGGEF